MENKNVLLEVKSKYKIIYESTFHLETLIILLILFIPAIQTGGTLVWLGVVLLYVLLLAIYMIFKKKQYESYKYLFYDDKLIYNNTFINKEQKQVSYKDIKEISYNQTFIGRLFKIGSIQIDTNSGSIFNKGIKLLGIENVEEVYEKIVKIISK